eukprot:IDg16091t1
MPHRAFASCCIDAREPPLLSTAAVGGADAQKKRGGMEPSGARRALLLR